MTTEAVTDLAALGASFVRDPHPVYARLRARGPVHRVRFPEGMDGWLVVGHEAARAALADPRLVKTVPGGNSAAEAGLLETDPPRHTRLRRLVAPHFTPRRVAALEPRVQEIADRLLDALLARPERRADLVPSLAFPLPLTVVCELLGVPDRDRAQVHRWSDTILHGGDEAAGSAAAEAVDGWLRGLVAERRERPDGDDLLSVLARTESGDGDCDGDGDGDSGSGSGRLSAAELYGTAQLLLVAGHETATGLIAATALALFGHPDQLAALRADTTLLDGAVEETLRHEGSVEQATFRFAAEPLGFPDGTVVPRGDLVVVSLASAGRDPARFPDPDTFDIRREARGHLAFGHGVHHCLGAPLARLEARVALRSLLERAPGLALDAAPAGLDWRRSMVVRTLRGLPVRW